MSAFAVSAAPIEPAALRSELTDPGCGGYVQFEGWVRNHNEGKGVLRLEYEVYELLAVKEGERIIAEAIERFGVRRAAAIHRSGPLELTDLAVLVGVASPHRAEAFRACRYIIDEIKVLGPGCSRCDQLTRDVMAVAAALNLQADVGHVTDVVEIGKYGVMGTPALVINGRVAAVGIVPPRHKLKQLLTAPEAASGKR